MLSNKVQLTKARLYIDTAQDWYHTSYVITGFVLNAERSNLELDVRQPSPNDWRRVGEGHACIHADVTTDDGATFAVVFDLHDQSTSFYEGALEHADVYLKRSYHQPDVERQPPHLRKKLLPFGLNFGCKSWESVRRLTAAMLPQACLQLVRTRTNPGRSWQHIIGNLLGFYRLPSLADYEVLPVTPKESTVLFQTRLWDEDRVVGEQADAVNEPRVQMIKLLRRQLGARFIGGLVPTPYARSRYPGLISAQHPRRYPTMLRNSLIGVYTRGLHHSTAWKLPEYVAANMCVVGEPVRNVLPRPLESGANVLTFTNPEECVASCVRILEDRSLQTMMRARTRAYFENAIEPGANVISALERAVAHRANESPS